MRNIQLVIIDPQNDFCDPNGALSVGGAWEDIKRISQFVGKSHDMLEDIRVTLDSHRLIHIAHPIAWINSDGKHPIPFENGLPTTITADDVRSGKWRATNPSWQERQKTYVETLEANGRYNLTIWPPHCLIGTWGHNVVPELADALRNWENDCFAVVDYVTKGSNCFTEHYSVVRADVIDDEDPTTALNTSFVESLRAADEILIAGEASSHCVANSVRDIATEFGDDQIQKIVYLEDASSPVPGCEQLGTDFVNEMVAKGMRVAKTTDF
jgi:nicotinamidase/pyrazinamidase